MLLTYEDLLRSMNDQLLSILSAMQQGSIDAYIAWMKAIAPMMPDLNFYHEMPTMLQDSFGDPDAIVDNHYDLIVSVVNLHREFVQAVFRASFIAPRTPHVPISR